MYGRIDSSRGLIGRTTVSFQRYVDTKSPLAKRAVGIEPARAGLLSHKAGMYIVDAVIYEQDTFWHAKNFFTVYDL